MLLVVGAKKALHPSIIAHRNRRTRPFPPYKAQQRPAPFQSRFEVFRREPKNRNVVLQHSNDRISIKGSFTPFYHSTTQHSHSPHPALNCTTTYDCFSVVLRYFVGSPKCRFFLTCCSEGRDCALRSYYPVLWDRCQRGVHGEAEKVGSGEGAKHGSCSRRGGRRFGEVLRMRRLVRFTSLC